MFRCTTECVGTDDDEKMEHVSGYRSKIMSPVLRQNAWACDSCGFLWISWVNLLHVLNGRSVDCFALVILMLIACSNDLSSPPLDLGPL